MGILAPCACVSGCEASRRVDARAIYERRAVESKATRSTAHHFPRLAVAAPLSLILSLCQKPPTSSLVCQTTNSLSELYSTYSYMQAYIVCVLHRVCRFIAAPSKRPRKSCTLLLLLVCSSSFYDLSLIGATRTTSGEYYLLPATRKLTKNSFSSLFLR